jgi:Family of unknown function (DUF5681)
MGKSFPKGNALGNRFKPGQSGNPGGRTKTLVEVARAAREYTLEAIETLAKIMRNDKASDAARVSAISILLDRGHGKAPLTINLNRDANLKDLTDDELLAIARGAEQQPDSSGDAPGAPPDKSKLN